MRRIVERKTKNSAESLSSKSQRKTFVTLLRIANSFVACRRSSSSRSGMLSNAPHPPLARYHG
jgi:hypothetical protein